MTGTKSMVHTEYLKSLEEKRSLPELSWKDRTVIIVGSDRKINVGAMVAMQVAGKGGMVIEGDKYDFKETQFRSCVESATDLVICCASVHMAWIEDITESDIYRVTSSIYCAGKAGLAHYARCAAWELTPKGFTIGMVHPGNIEGTPMTEDTIEGIAAYRNISMDEARDYWASAKLTEKWLRPREVSDEVMHLLKSTPHHSGIQVELAGGMR
jgi:NAD(P)-dependent dehydrogenase (short-subunit alcohol dehydrogenase family)